MDILVTEEIESPALTALEHKYRVVREPTVWSQRIRLSELLSQAKTIIVRNQTQLTADLLASAPRLLAIGRHGVGLDNIDVETASKLGIVVLAPLGANATSVAEFTIGLMVSLARRIP